MRNFNWSLSLAFAVITAMVVCSLKSTSPAAPPRESNQPFANAVEQRAETVEQLREIAKLLREQNALLTSGKVRVVIEADKPARK